MKPRDKQVMRIGMLVAVLLLTILVGIEGIYGFSREAELPSQPTTQPAETLPPPPANPYGPEDFRLEDGYLTCSAGETVRGIDVSSHQKEIDWQAVADSGVKFAIIRLGYRGYESGEISADQYAQQNLAMARAAGIKIGAYFYSQAVSPEEAAEEARFALQQLGGLRLDMPLVFDWEYVSETARTANVKARTLTDSTLAFCRTVEAAGYRPMVYFNQSQAEHLLYLSELTAYDFWLAMYDRPMEFPYRVDMWQYTASGTVPGIQGNVDINLQFLYS